MALDLKVFINQMYKAELKVTHDLQHNISAMRAI
jgi:hypothetical protein